MYILSELLLLVSIYMLIALHILHCHSKELEMFLCDPQRYLLRGLYYCLLSLSLSLPPSLSLSQEVVSYFLNYHLRSFPSFPLQRKYYFSAPSLSDMNDWVDEVGKVGERGRESVVGSTWNIEQLRQSMKEEESVNTLVEHANEREEEEEEEEDNNNREKKSSYTRQQTAPERVGRDFTGKENSRKKKGKERRRVLKKSKSSSNTQRVKNEKIRKKAVRKRPMKRKKYKAKAKTVS